MTERLTKPTKTEIERIYKIWYETRVSMGDICILFNHLNPSDISNICKENDFTNITKKIKIDKDYSNKLIRQQSIFPLGETYVKEIYYFSHNEKISNNIVCEIFGVSESTLERIRSKKSTIYRDILAPLRKPAKCKNGIKIKKPCRQLKPKEQRILLNSCEKINKGEMKVRELSKLLNITTDTVRRYFRIHGKKIESKYSPVKLSDETVLKIFDEAHLEEKPLVLIAEEYGVIPKTVSRIKRGETHKNLLYRERYEELMKYEEKY